MKICFFPLSVYAALGPLKEDVSRIGADDDDRQAKGLFIALPDWRFIVARDPGAMNGARCARKGPPARVRALGPRVMAISRHRSGACRDVSLLLRRAVAASPH